MTDVNIDGVTVSMPVVHRTETTGLAIPNGSSAIDNDKDSSNSSSEKVQQMNRPSSVSNATPAPEVVEINGIPIRKTVCNRAFKKFGMYDLIKPAKTLFKEIFENVNICAITPESLDEDRKEAIYETLARIRGMKKKGLRSFDLSQEIEIEEFTDVEREYIKNQVFVQYRSYLVFQRKNAVLQNKIKELTIKHPNYNFSTNRRNKPMELKILDGTRVVEVLCLDNNNLQFYPKPK